MPNAHPLKPEFRERSSPQSAKWVDVEVARVTFPERVSMSHNKDRIKSAHMKSLVLTEYWKVVDSQSGRQSHWVAETFLIALKNLGVSSRLGGYLIVFQLITRKFILFTCRFC